jgi:hypothetical protein
MSLTKKDLAYPFTPEVKIFLKADEGDASQKYGRLELKHPTGDAAWGFTDVSLTLKITADVDKEFDL